MLYGLGLDVGRVNQNAGIHFEYRNITSLYPSTISSDSVAK